VDANFKTLGSFAIPTKELNREVTNLVDGVTLDIAVINKINQNQLYMSQSEKQIVLNSVKGMYQGMKSLTLNYA
jgi:cell division protein FtsB